VGGGYGRCYAIVGTIVLAIVFTIVGQVCLLLGTGAFGTNRSPLGQGEMLAQALWHDRFTVSLNGSA